MEVLENFFSVLDTTTTVITTAFIPANTDDLPLASTMAASAMVTVKCPLSRGFGIHWRMEPTVTPNLERGQIHRTTTTMRMTTLSMSMLPSSTRTATQQRAMTSTSRTTTARTHGNFLRRSSLTIKMALHQLSNVYDGLKELWIPPIEDQRHLFP